MHREKAQREGPPIGRTSFAGRLQMPNVWRSGPASEPSVRLTRIHDRRSFDIPPGTNSSPIEDTRRRSPGVLLFFARPTQERNALQTARQLDIGPVGQATTQGG